MNLLVRTLSVLTIFLVAIHLSGYNKISSYPQWASQVIHTITVKSMRDETTWGLDIAENFDITGGFDARAIQEVCSNVVWQEGLVFSHRTSTQGGGGNVRNAFLVGLRFAIEAGGMYQSSLSSFTPDRLTLQSATGYVLGRIVERSPCNLTLTKPQYRSITYMFDRTHFIKTMAITCPRIRIYSDISELSAYDWASPENVIAFQPNDLDDDEHDPEDYAVHNPESWRQSFDSWLAEKGGVSPYSPTLLQIDNSFLEWPIHQDSPAFVKSFSHPLRSTYQIRHLAQRVLENLSDQFDLQVDMYTVPKLGAKTFMGAHLRTDHDVAGIWTSYEEQAWTFLNISHTEQLSVIYCATGDAGHLKQMKFEGSTYWNITVVSKTDLLYGDDLEELKGLSWDQQGLVDYEIMLRSAVFSGLMISSFSYNAAVKRHSVGMTSDPAASWPDDMLEVERDFGKLWWSTVSNENVDKVPPNDGLSYLIGGPLNETMLSHGIWP